MRSMNNSKNKLNSKISWQKICYQNGLLVPVWVQLKRNASAFQWTLSTRLGTAETQCICISMFFLILSFIEKHVLMLFSGSVHCLRDPQT